MQMVNEKFEDINGRKWKLHIVRSDGRGRFMILNKLRNTVETGFKTRDEAWDYLKDTRA